MDDFEKQQTIEALKTVIKARWFYALAIFAQGIVLKLAFYAVPLPNNWQILLILAIVLIFNFIFWLCLSRVPEKVNDTLLKLIRFSQVPLELFGLAAITYYSGTANKLLIIMFVIPIMVGTAIYKTRGIILATIAAMALYSGLLILDYYGLLSPLTPEAIAQAPGKIFTGQLGLTKYQLVGFNMYLMGAAFYAGFLSNLFKRREKSAISQKNELAEKTNILTIQTRELTRTKDYLHEALTKSDKARTELEKTKADLEKSNLELKAKLDEVEKYSEVTTGRELKMMELKEKMKQMENEINELRKKLETR